MTHSPIRPWLRLSLEPGLAPAVCRALLAHAGSAPDVYALSHEALAPFTGHALARQLRAAPAPALAAAIDKALDWASQPGHHLIALDGAAYPAMLREMPDPPVLLYVTGEPACLSLPAVAIVGARSATPGGLDNAREFAHCLAGRGWCVVSGLASGIDAAAHEGALDAGHDGAGTVAVIGTGADIVYPARNRNLACRIAQHGAIVSELPLGMPALRHQFPRRNRLVAGLAQGVLVVEAAMKSGSLITARLAGEMGREVFAMPGSIHSPLSRGCHALIRQGAKLTETVEDITCELRVPGAPAAGGRPRDCFAAPIDEAASDDTPPSHDDAVLQALGYDPVLVDDLQRRLQWPASQVLARLLALELSADVARLPGGRFQRRRKA